MLMTPLFLLTVLAGALHGTAVTPLDSNLAYRSPFSDHPQVLFHLSFSFLLSNHLLIHSLVLTSMLSINDT
jgi:hypothetical protein